MSGLWGTARHAIRAEVSMKSPKSALGSLVPCDPCQGGLHPKCGSGWSIIAGVERCCDGSVVPSQPRVFTFGGVR